MTKGISDAARLPKGGPVEARGGEAFPPRVCHWYSILVCHECQTVQLKLLEINTIKEVEGDNYSVPLDKRRICWRSNVNHIIHLSLFCLYTWTFCFHKTHYWNLEIRPSNSKLFKVFADLFIYCLFMEQCFHFICLEKFVESCQYFMKVYYVCIKCSYIRKWAYLPFCLFSLSVHWINEGYYWKVGI